MLSVHGVMQESAAAQRKAPGSSRFLDVSQRTGTCTGTGSSAPAPQRSCAHGPPRTLPVNPRGAFGVLRDSGLRVPEMPKEQKVGEDRGGEGG